jgi:hypothetical protein
MSDEDPTRVTRVPRDPEPTAALEFSDRYGGHYPDPETVCDGDCEGLGVYPAHVGSEAEAIAEQDAKPDPDGWAFIRCQSCFGTGKRRDLITMSDLLKLWQPREPAAGEKTGEKSA